MSACNATLTTVTFGPKGPRYAIMHTLTCDRTAGHPPDVNGREFHAVFAQPDDTPLPQFVTTWQDDTPGATPHSD